MVSSDLAAINPNRNIWVVLVCVNAGAPFFEIREYRSGGINPAAALLSAAFVLVALNLIALWSLFARARRNGWQLQRKKFILAGGAMAVIAFLSITTAVSLVKPRDNYFDLAMSDRPLSSIKPDRKRIIVEYIRRSAANSREENKAMAEAQKRPIDPAVYSPDSSSNKEVMRSTLSHLTTYINIDFEYFAKQQVAREEFRRKMAACDPEYLKSWDASRADYEEMQESANRAEHDWFTSVNQLYSFGEQYAGQIAVKEGEVSISDPAVRRKFNDLLRESQALHGKLESVVHAEVKRQQQAKADIGG